jgi:hypothetical protein
VTFSYLDKKQELMMFINLDPHSSPFVLLGYLVVLIGLVGMSAHFFSRGLGYEAKRRNGGNILATFTFLGLITSVSACVLVIFLATQHARPKGSTSKVSDVPSATGSGMKDLNMQAGPSKSPSQLQIEVKKSKDILLKRQDAPGAKKESAEANRYVKTLLQDDVLGKKPRSAKGATPTSRPAPRLR